MKGNDLKKAIEHNKNVLKQLGINLTSAEKGTFSVKLQKRVVRRKNLLTSELEEKEI